MFNIVAVSHGSNIPEYDRHPVWLTRFSMKHPMMQCCRCQWVKAKRRWLACLPQLCALQKSRVFLQRRTPRVGPHVEAEIIALHDWGRVLPNVVFEVVAPPTTGAECETQKLQIPATF